MDISEIIEFLSKNEQLLRSNNFNKLFRNWDSFYGSFSWSALADFLLNTVGIPFLNYMTTITDYMFYGNFSSFNVYVPGSIKEIRSGAFYNNNLEKIIIEDVSKIDSRAFRDCNSLKSVEIDGNITRLLTDTFKDCEALSYVYIPESVVSLASDVFNGVNDNIVIVTPWREEKSKKLRIPNSEIAWYKQHLKFRHAPKNVVDDQEGEE